MTYGVPDSKAFPPSYHIVGIAGAGMSALAQVLIAQGFRVSGSDRYLDSGRRLIVLEKLKDLGVELVPQNGNGINPQISAVVISSAIEQDNPDLIAANRLEVPVIHRAEMLAQLVSGNTLIAVTGTSGKTTVTGMLGWILEQTGRDPTVVNGGVVLNWLSERVIGNVRMGSSRLWVVELDESDKSLLKFYPDFAVITNISKDHFELAEVKNLFKRFSYQVKGPVIGCFDNDDYNAALHDAQLQVSASECKFQYKGVAFSLSLPGRHNAENALQTVMLCEQLGLELAAVNKAFKGFKGIQRRLERVGDVNGIAVIDDYAHNPAKITAAYQAVAPFFKRIFAIWQPHGFKPLALMSGELLDVFAGIIRESDRVYILPAYFAGGTVERLVSSELFVERLQKRHVPASYVPSYSALLPRILNEVSNGDAVLFMGARDPAIPVIARRFTAELQNFLMNGMA